MATLEQPAASTSLPHAQSTLVSVVIPTRNRGRQLQMTLHAALSGSLVPIEIIIADQSDPAQAVEARAAVQLVADNLGVEVSYEREGAATEPGAALIRYIACHRRGAGAGRNTGARAARGSVVLFIDDDTIAASNWVAVTDHEYAKNPQMVGLYGRILPYEHASGSAGEYHGTEVIRDGSGRIEHTTPILPWYLGSGGNMSFRRAAMFDCGGFDEVLTIGGPFRAFEDLDLGHRLLLRRAGSIAFCSDSLVFHDSPKSFAEQLHTEAGYGISVGAAFVKYLRAGDPGAWRMFLSWIWQMAIRRTGAGLFKWRNWRVVRLALIQLWYPLVGILRAYHWPIDTQQLTFIPSGRPAME